MTKSKRAKWISVLILVMLFVYLDKPDRGGFQRCKALSGVHGLEDFVTHKVALWRWQPFETPRFRFRMPVSNFDALKTRTGELGFDEWKKGGGQFGSFIEFSSDDSPLYYTRKYEHGKTSFVYYRPKTERLDVLIWPTR